MDMDATIKGYPVNEDSVRKMIEDIMAMHIEDDVSFELKSVGEIREGDEYTGYRVALSANYPPMAVPLKLDITTGDIITPKEIKYKYTLMMEERTIQVLAYNLETILAEKLETVISRGNQNTRPRDYYDIFILTGLQEKNIDMDSLSLAIDNTAKKRATTEIIKNYKSIMETVKTSDVMTQRWNDYRKDFDYAHGIEFKDTCEAVVRIMNRIVNYVVQ